MISDLFTKGIKEADPEVYGTLSRELERQQNQIELIASENIASKSILNAQGSVMTNKYAEGYPGKRYYGGCEFVDQAEDGIRDPYLSRGLGDVYKRQLLCRPDSNFVERKA